MVFATKVVMYGLALGGASGVDSMIDFSHRETIDMMLHLGVERIDALDPKHIRKSAAPCVHGPVRVGFERLGWRAKGSSKGGTGR